MEACGPWIDSNNGESFQDINRRRSDYRKLCVAYRYYGYLSTGMMEHMGFGMWEYLNTLAHCNYMAERYAGWVKELHEDSSTIVQWDSEATSRRRRGGCIVSRTTVRLSARRDAANQRRARTLLSHDKGLTSKVGRF